LEEVTQILPPEREWEEWKGEKILLGLGFTEENMLQDPNTFSGGNQVKINLAKILLQEPDILLLDEPTNYLDIYAIRWLEGFLKKWKGELVLITHDRAFMDSVISHTVIIHRGKFRKIRGSTGKIREQIDMEEEIYEKTRIKEEEKRKETEEWIKRFGAKASKAAAAQSRQKQLDKQEERPALTKLDSLNFKFTYVPYGSGGNMVEVNKLKFYFDPEKVLMSNLSFSVNHGDKICIIGKNGNGKSTLMKLIYDELKPIEGTIVVNNKVQCGYFGQTNIDHLHPDNTICQEMETVESEKPIEYSTVRRICAQMMFPGDLAHKKISVLSGGEKSRVMLGKILLSSSNLLLLDEPTNHFDIESCESLMEAIQEFQGAVVMVTHDEHFLKNIANKLVIFDGGKTFVFEGTYEAFLSKIGWSEVNNG
jgi:ATP-binding cassette subfamily F protein 3